MKFFIWIQKKIQSGKLIVEFWKFYYLNLETDIWILKKIIQIWKLLHILIFRMEMSSFKFKYNFEFK